mmetsp:Transcript_25535/g.51895  ORF Transcript_25535/g.51895 Transcript_25535/m.51895 type:complete len:166 (-) Transcript_25535:212-709(-)
MKALPLISVEMKARPRLCSLAPAAHGSSTIGGCKGPWPLRQGPGRVFSRHDHHHHHHHPNLQQHLVLHHFLHRCRLVPGGVLTWDPFVVSLWRMDGGREWQLTHHGVADVWADESILLLLRQNDLVDPPFPPPPPPFPPAFRRSLCSPSSLLVALSLSLPSHPRN